MKGKIIVKWTALLVILIAVVVSGCSGTNLAPQMSYQGRLTNPSGEPLNGSYDMSFAIHNSATGGTALYTETDSVTVTDGLFDTVVGPGSAVSGLEPADLAQPLWLEVQVSDGAITETLTPRQRLYGAPYAFTLMPGTVISKSLQYQGAVNGNINGLVNVQNNYDGDFDFAPLGNAALPALSLVGETTLELKSPTSTAAGVFSDRSNTESDYNFYTNDDVLVYLDHDSNSTTSLFRVYGDPTSNYCQFNEVGNFYCTGTKSSIVDTNDEKRALYAIESPEVWFEDFGGGVLQNGSAQVSIDPLFAGTVNLDEYHVFVTPLGECAGLFVTNKTAEGFEVHELGGGTSDVAFDYRIVAHRAGFEQVRMQTDSSFGIDEVDE